MKTILLIPILFITTFYSWSNVVIVKVNYSYLNFDKIDDRNLKTFEFGSIFSERAKTELSSLNSSFNGIIKWKAEKIFFNLTTKDTISVSRLGEKVTIPPFWATFRLHVPSNFSTERIIQFLDNFQPLVEYAHYDFPAYLQSTPNDTLYNKQISLNGSALHPNAGINIEDAWNIEKGKSFIKVGVHDSGIDSLHPDLDVVFGGAYFEENLPNLPLSWGTGGQHGTGVAGIIAAKRNNTTGIAGIAGGDNTQGSGISLIDLKVDFLNQNNVASYICASVVDAARSVGSYWDYPDGYYSAENSYFDNAKGFGIHVGNHSYIIKTNNSIPIETESNSVEKELDNPSVSNPSCVLCREAYLFSLKNGVINVVARGNSQNFPLSADPRSIDYLYPQSFPDNWIVSVGASGYDGITVQNGINQSLNEQFNNFWSLYGSNMDIIAPGSDSIVYTTNVYNSSTNSNPYRKMNGTSAAAPHVSGVAALLLSHYNQNCYSHSNLAVEDVEYILEKSATNLYGAGYDDTTGWGRLDAYKALQMIENPTKQIVHPDSLVSSVVVERDTIVFKYNKAFVADGWGPLSKPFPLTQNKVYQAERILVENTYSFSEFITSSTEILDYWPIISSSNAIDYLDDSLRVFIPKPPMGQIDTTLSFDVFDVTPFNSIYFFDPNEKLVKTRGYYYHFIVEYEPVIVALAPDELIISQNIDSWYPINIENQEVKMPVSIYIKDTLLTTKFNSPCDSLNPLYDESVSLNDIKLMQDLLIFPNPTNQNVTIKSINNFITSVYLIDNQGKTILHSNELTKELKLDLSDLKSGFYFIKCNTDSGLITKKIIKL